VVAFIDDDVPVCAGEIGDVVASGQGGQHRNIDDAAEFASAAADLAGSDAQEVFDAGTPCSARALRSTRTSVEVPRSAITAQAMTVFPDPGGATSMPSSCASRALTTTACMVVRSAVQDTSISWPGFRTSVTANRDPACSTTPLTNWRRPRGSTNRSSMVRS
jgi:hypothetical protein